MGSCAHSAQVGSERSDHVRELYGIEISTDLVSAVTIATQEVAAWQAGPLKPDCPIVSCSVPQTKTHREVFVEVLGLRQLQCPVRSSKHRRLSSSGVGGCCHALVRYLTQ